MHQQQKQQKSLFETQLSKAQKGTPMLSQHSQWDHNAYKRFPRFFCLVFGRGDQKLNEIKISPTTFETFIDLRRF
jgi:hypothetical protein